RVSPIQVIDCFEWGLCRCCEPEVICPSRPHATALGVALQTAESRFKTGRHKDGEGAISASPHYVCLKNSVPGIRKRTNNNRAELLAGKTDGIRIGAFHGNQETIITRQYGAI